MAGSLDNVTIKKEIEDSLDSPENADTQDSGQGQSEGQSNQKLSKVWGEDETRSLIEFAKVYLPKCKDSSYTRKHLLEDISNELQLIGYDCTPENVRNKLKYLRSRYKGFVDYNSKHVQKRTMLYSDELAELYNADYFEDQDGMSNGSSDSKGSSTKKGQKSTIPASHVDLGTVVTSTKKRPAAHVVQKSAKVLAKKGSKSRSQPLFQCGLCMEKFKTSFDMHGHVCGPAKEKESPKKKTGIPPLPSSSTLLTVWLKPTGNAPIIKNRKWNVDRDTTVGSIMGFLKQYLSLGPSDSVFLYVNQSFAPSPDHEVGNLYECFNMNGKLVLHYSTSPAWG